MSDWHPRDDVPGTAEMYAWNDFGVSGGASVSVLSDRVLSLPPRLVPGFRLRDRWRVQAVMRKIQENET